MSSVRRSLINSIKSKIDKPIYTLIRLNETDIDGYYLSPTGALVQSSSYKITPYYDISGYDYVYWEESNLWRNVILYNENKEFVYNLDDIKSSYFKIPNNVRYIRFSGGDEIGNDGYAILYNLCDKCKRVVIDTIDIQNSYLGNNGAVVSSNGYGISPYYNLDFRGLYSKVRDSCFYDNNKNFILMMNEQIRYYSCVPKTPASALYYRISATNGVFTDGHHIAVNFDIKTDDYILTIDEPNTYLNSGRIVAYNGWGTSPYYELGDSVFIPKSISGAYCAFYDENKEYISNVNTSASQPSNAVYVRLSAANSAFNGSNIVNIYHYNILNR